MPCKLYAYGDQDLYQQAVDFCQAWTEGLPHLDIPTSGSTGAPKAIRLTRAQLLASAQATAQRLGLTEGDHALLCLPIQYIAGRMMLVRALAVEMHLHLRLPLRDPLDGLPEGLSFDFAAVVPLQLEALLGQPARTAAYLGGAKAVLVGGAPLSPDLEEAAQDFPAPLWATYGMTETATHIALRRINGPERSACFTALPGIEIGTDTRDCLTIQGAVTGHQRLTTNDRVRLEGKDRFVWLGRADWVINSGGIKLQPEVIEQEAAAYLGQTVCVLGVPDAQLGQRAVLLIERAEALTTAEQDIWLRDLKARLPLHHAPKTLAHWPRFPRTPTQKIDRQRLLRDFLGQ
ncbi:MAG: AMP-binding protein [Bernardetiaceae bacterium]